MTAKSQKIAAEKLKIIMDTKEPPLIRERLLKMGCDVVTKDISRSGGHYILGNGAVGIERQSMKAFFVNVTQNFANESGVMPFNIYERIMKLRKNYKTRVLIIEGEKPRWEAANVVKVDDSSYQADKGELLGTMLGVAVWCIRYNITTVNTRNAYDSARLIYGVGQRFAKKSEKPF